MKDTSNKKKEIRNAYINSTKTNPTVSNWMLIHIA